LCKLLKKLHPEWISGYHEHDSLLEHRYAEELTEEEQKKAWENYEAKKTETQDYVARAVLMSQLHQQQSTMLATSNALSNPVALATGNNQPIAMPYMNQPQPPVTTDQGVDHVIQLAFTRCQELTNICRNITSINAELAKPSAATDSLREMRKKRIEHLVKCCAYLQESAKLISIAIQSFGAVPTYQAKLAAAKQFILDAIHSAARVVKG